MYKFIFVIVIVFIYYNQSKAQTLAANIDSFYAVKGDFNGDNKLIWLCSNQFNLANFIIEKSVNKGATWEKLGEMPPSVVDLTNNKQATYNFSDRLANRSKSAVYKLKTVEKLNYVVDYFPLIWNEPDYIYATYQQQRKQLQISHTFALNKVINLKIYNIQNQLVFAESIVLNKNNMLINIPLVEGFYLISYDNLHQKLAVLY